MATYTIEAAAAETGVSAHTLRYYERIGLLERVDRSANGHRRYTEDDLGGIRFLTMLRATGMSIRRMTEFVDLTRAGDDTIPLRVEALEGHREALRARMEADREHLVALDRKIGIYTALLAREPLPA